ncbi:ribonuclease VapC [Candidatus Bathyarchaeota archaeon]|nr:ribonuclease VapC [Candidatus Bathyarchaeota archaeon]
MSLKHRSLVLDTSAFIAGFDPSAVSEETYSVPDVETELLDETTPKLRFTTSVESGKLMLIKPVSKYIDIVRSTSSEIGDAGFLSNADIAVLALAAQLKENGQNPVIITDDYSIQNVAEKLGLEFASLANFGIKYQLHWLLYCPACGKKYPPHQKTMICENCGTQLKRKPEKKILIKKKTGEYNLPKEKGESQET